MSAANPLVGSRPYAVSTDQPADAQFSTSLPGGHVVIDGTPVRVAGILFLSGALLFSLRQMGLKFNVGV